MNYHNITMDDMNNGPGLRTTLFVSGCSHHCEGCHNKETWYPNSGILFDEMAVDEIIRNLSQDHIKGITLSGGDPFYITNAEEIAFLVEKIVNTFGNKKTIMVYTGFKLETLLEFYGKEYCSAIQYNPSMLKDRWIYRDELSQRKDIQQWLQYFGLGNEESNCLLIYKWFFYVSYILQNTDHLVDGKFVKALADVGYKWAGSRNQKVILDLPEYLDSFINKEE